jgi:hypothetical protein
VKLLDEVKLLRRQAKISLGEFLLQMAERGERRPHGGDQRAQRAPRSRDLGGVTPAQAVRCRAVAQAVRDGKAR